MPIRPNFRFATIAPVSAAIAALVSGCAAPALQESVQREATATQAVVSTANPAAPISARAAQAASAAGGAMPQVIGSAGSADARAAAALSRRVFMRSNQRFVAAEPTKYAAVEKYPPILLEQIEFKFGTPDGRDRVPLTTVLDRIYRATKIPVRVASDVFGAAGVSQPRAPAIQQLPPPVVSGGAQANNAGPLPGLATPAGAAARPVDQAATSLQPRMAMSPAVVTLTQPTSFASNDRMVSLSSIGANWSGNTAGFLDHLSEALGLSWEYSGGVITMRRFVTESFEIARLDSDQSYQMSLSSEERAGSAGTSGGASGSGSGASDVRENGSNKVIAPILDGVKQILAAESGANVVHSSATGSLVVTASRNTMSRVREYVRTVNASLTRQVQVQFEVYSVRRNNANQSGIDWSVVFQSVKYAVAGSFNTPASLVGATAGGLGISILPDVADNTASRRFGGSSALLQALREYGTVVQGRPVSMIACNGCWTRKANVRVDGYVSETVSSGGTLTGGGLPGIKTSSIVTGDRFLVRPFMLDNGVIELKMAINLSTLDNLADISVGAGASQQKVQLPSTSAAVDQTSVYLRPGQMIALTGLVKSVAADTTRSLAEGLPAAAGGSFDTKLTQEEVVVLVRVVPLSVDAGG